MFRRQSGGCGHEFFDVAPVDLGEERFAVAFAVEQPDDVEIGEINVRPTAQA
ncbi:hypothetical protein [Streptomyces djakartensis]|uniref:Uncharacterized protein n=1 Tax=Streptomyces djakartensis TaxID=68193 RepID=A0ABQ2ZSN8_9ACTN|nr:hypothetical protein [Streptomyces djakartensis]GGY24308.1 hypothetical protein GCM10010384_34070 [Streptomyces djakartensis]